MELKWTKGEKGALRPGMYIVRAFGKQYAIEAGPEGVKESCWNPTPGHFICGPLDIAEPDPELELPEGWVKDENTSEYVLSVWTWGTGTVQSVRVTVNSHDPVHRIRAVNAAVKALEERHG